MNPPTADKLDLPALAPDPSIERTLGDLRTKLAAWAAAMERAQAHLDQRAAGLELEKASAVLSRPLPEPDAAPEVAAPGPAAAQTDDAETEAPAALIRRSSPEAEPEPEPGDAPPIRTPRISSAAARDVEPRLNEPPTGSDRKCESGQRKAVLRKGRGISPGPAAPAPPASAGSPQSAEDEALLAQLPPEVAAAIRVKRRLTGNRRSVADLVREYQESSGHARPGDGAGWSWWSRGKK